jgi:hypothetical protein
MNLPVVNSQKPVIESNPEIDHNCVGRLLDDPFQLAVQHDGSGNDPFVRHEFIVRRRIDI